MKFIFVIGAVAATIVSLTLVALSVLTRSAGGTPVRTTPELRNRLTKGWILRAGAADRTVVLFSDFQCPACRDELARILQGDPWPGYTVVLRNFPLRVHPDARRMADLVATLPDDAAIRRFVTMILRDQACDYTSAAAVYKRMFRRDPGRAALRRAAARVANDVLLGDGLRVRATPTAFVLNRDGSCARF